MMSIQHVYLLIQGKPHKDTVRTNYFLNCGKLLKIGTLKTPRKQSVIFQSRMVLFLGNTAN